MSGECIHDTIVFTVEANEYAHPDGPFLAAVAQVRCDDCGVLFSWRGLNSGVINPHEPVVSADGYELRAPIVPRPGGVVGVLSMAGLEDRLKEPSG